MRTCLTLMCVLVAFSGCFSLGRDAPPVRHYVLGGSAGVESAAGTPGASGLTGLRVGLRQVQVAEYLETPLVVVRQGPNEIRFSEYHRWGEDLQAGVNRAVARHLRAAAGFESVSVAPWAPGAAHDVLIQTHLLRFEGSAPADPAATQGEARLVASWELIGPANGAVLARGTTDYRGPGWTIGDIDGLVILLDAGLLELSDDLVEALASVAVP